MRPTETHQAKTVRLSSDLINAILALGKHLALTPREVLDILEESVPTAFGGRQPSEMVRTKPSSGSLHVRPNDTQQHREVRQ